MSRIKAIKEKGEDMWKEVEVDGDGYLVYCKERKRDVMEDRFKAVVEFNGHQKQAFFGVFDGHGGPKAAEFAAENLNKNIVTEVEKFGENNIIESIRQGFMTVAFVVATAKIARDVKDKEFQMVKRLR